MRGKDLSPKIIKNGKLTSSVLSIITVSIVWQSADQTREMGDASE